MRPVVKLSVGSEIELGSGKEQIAATYNPYQKAKPALIASLGRYCSYCECAYQQARDLHVEHVQPKSLPQYVPLQFAWSNFLLSCATCNGPDNKHNKDVCLEDVHLPHQNNTFLSLVYKDGGVVMVNPDLKGSSRHHAESLLELVGLDKGPATSSPGDTRWRVRKETWHLAERYEHRYAEGQCDLEAIIDLAKARGLWSIWFTVFAAHSEVRKRLITDFPGTASHCFDDANGYEPFPRNPHNVNDPV